MSKVKVSELKRGQKFIKPLDTLSGYLPEEVLLQHPEIQSGNKTVSEIRSGLKDSIDRYNAKFPSQNAGQIYMKIDLMTVLIQGNDGKSMRADKEKVWLPNVISLETGEDEKMDDNLYVELV